jgi:hypothetical protein
MRTASLRIGTGFFVDKDAANMPNDQAITHRQIRVIRANRHRFRSPLSRGTMQPSVVLTAISGPND